MIFKGKHRKTASFKQLLEYLLNDKGRGLEESTPIITHNVRGENIEDWAADLASNEYQGQPLRKNRIRVLHEIISFHDRDKGVIGPEILNDMAYEYINARNPNGMYVIIPHVQDDHVHLHVCGSPWEYLGGKSLRLSKADLKELKDRLEDMQRQRYPELIYSRGNHGKLMSRNLDRGIDNSR